MKIIIGTRITTPAYMIDFISFLSDITSRFFVHKLAVRVNGAYPIALLIVRYPSGSDLLNRTSFFPASPVVESGLFPVVF